MLAETGISLARRFDLDEQEFTVSITPKYVKAMVFDYQANVDSADEDDFDADDYTEEYTDFNLDIGASLEFAPGWRAGLVVKNIISREYEATRFDVPTGNAVELNPQLRAGVSWFNLLFGSLPFFLFGLLLQTYPEWLRGTAVRYARFGSLFFLMLGAQLAFYLSELLTDGPGVVYLLLLLCWYLGITTLKAISMLASNIRLVLVRWIEPSLKIAVFSLLVAAGGLLSGWSELVACALVAGLTFSFALILWLNLMTHLSHTAGQVRIL